MKVHAHFVFVLVLLALPVTLPSSVSADAHNSVPGASSGFVPTAEVPGLPGAQSGSSLCRGDSGFIPLECFEGSRRLEGVYRSDNLGGFVQKVFVGTIALGAILAVLRLAWAGFVYMSSDLWTSKERAKEIIRETLEGLLILLAIWLVLNQINPDLLNLDILRSVSPANN